MTLEVRLEESAVKRVKRELGVESLKLNVRSNTGWPDRLFWVPGGRPFLIEFKRPGEEPTPKQLYIHERLRAAGYQVEVHDDVSRAVSAVARAVGAARVSKARR